MRRLSKKEWIATVVALGAAGTLFFGFNYATRFLNLGKNPASAKLSAEQNTMDTTQKQTVTQGQGTVAEAGDNIVVHYTGTLEDGSKFDSSYDRGTPFSFVLGAGRVIRGWDQGLIGAKKGDKLKLVIPGPEAYGAAGIPDGRGGYIIPPNATLIFDVEVVDVEKASLR